MALCAADAPPPSTRVRRLTKAEIQSSTAVALGDQATDALANLDSDSLIEGGYSNSDQLLVSSSFANGLNLAADAIGTQFKATVTKSSFDAGCFASDSAAQACAVTFIRGFGAKIFRRDVTDDDVTALTAVYVAGRDVGIDGNASDRFATGLSWVVRAMVQSPDFLYLTELGDAAVASGGRTTLRPHEIASALSYAILGLPPDDELAAAAQRNELATAAQRAAQVSRLIEAYPESWKQQMRTFVPQWLGINFDKPEWSKNTDEVPLYSGALRAAVRTETEKFIDDWATAPEGPRLDTLLTTPATFINATNAPLYGLTATGDTFQKIGLDPTQRAGILTLGGFLGSTSHVGETSPVMRGRAVMEKLLCLPPPPPPPMVPPLPPLDKAEPTTTRARFAAHLASDSCSGCHARFDPMGNAFEMYDPIGAIRTEQNGHPIDTTGALVGAAGGERPVANAVELMSVLAETPETSDCVTRQLFRFTMGRTEQPYDQCNVQRARKALDGARDLRDVVSSIVSSDSFVKRTVNR